MKILPIRTALADAALPQRHVPTAGTFTAYRACLRWDFGFTCAFCLLHEADLTEHGIAGTGLMSIEHVVPQSKDASLIDVYTNCRLACRFCNRARHDAMRTDPFGVRLLDPCEVAWSAHFEIRGAELVPLDGDRDAARTSRTYGLDDERKTKMRRDRAESLDRALRAVREVPALERAALAKADTADAAARRGALETAEWLRGWLAWARRTIERYRAVPLDAPAACRCGPAGERELPSFLTRQLLDA